MMKKKKQFRRKERELGVMGIFRLDYGDDNTVPISEIIDELPDDEETIDLKDTSGGYANKIVDTYLAHKDEVDELITQKLKKEWTFDSLPIAERAIMRVAVTEMLMMEEPVPKEIAINEAVELAKKYGEDQATSYINGILNKIAKDFNLADYENKPKRKNKAGSRPKQKPNSSKNTQSESKPEPTDKPKKEEE